MSDKLKNVLGWVIIISLIILAGAAWRYVGAYARSIQPSSFRSFAVSGEGRAVVMPDIARFSFGVITEGDNDIGRLQTDNTTQINQAIDFLKKQGIEAKDIKTSGYNLTPRYQTGVCREICPPPAIVGYRVSQTVTVKIRKAHFDKIGVVLAGVIEQGANNVSQLNFTLDDPAAAENEARAAAIAEAKIKAKTVARAAGFSLGQLLAIDEGGSPYNKMSMSEMAYGRGGADAGAPALPAPTIEPGSQEVNVTVTLRYEID